MIRTRRSIADLAGAVALLAVIMAPGLVGAATVAVLIRWLRPGRKQQKGDRDGAA